MVVCRNRLITVNLLYTTFCQSTISSQDELGTDYQEITKKVAEQVITEPEKVVALNETAYGNTLVSKSPNREEIGNQIINWLKEYMSK